MKNQVYLSPEQMEKQKKKEKKAALIAIPIGIVVFLLIIISSGGGSEPEVPSKNKIKMEAKVMARTYIRQQLKAPESAKFGYENVSMRDSVTYVVQNTVDAQNSFGAMLRMNYKVILKYNGENPEVIKNWELVDFKLK